MANMKLLVIFITLVASGKCNEKNGTECDSNCKDSSVVCEAKGIEKLCQDQNLYSYFVKQKCRKTCGICNSCKEIQARSCDAGSCKDKSSWCSILAPAYCDYDSFGLKIANLCKKSCRACTCAPSVEIQPRQLTSCREDCMDKYENCKFWEQQGSCASYWQKNWMKQNCPMSCQVCRRCEVKEKVLRDEEEAKSS